MDMVSTTSKTTPTLSITTLQRGREYKGLQWSTASMANPLYSLQLLTSSKKKTLKTLPADYRYLLQSVHHVDVGDAIFVPVLHSLLSWGQGSVNHILQLFQSVQYHQPTLLGESSAQSILVGDSTMNWQLDYLPMRSQFVGLSSCTSDTRTCQTGALWRAARSPFLFIFYTSGF